MNKALNKQIHAKKIERIFEKTKNKKKKKKKRKFLNKNKTKRIHLKHSQVMLCFCNKILLFQTCLHIAL
jgi:hypothetical protein